jgi:hypothetical protein
MTQYIVIDRASGYIFYDTRDLPLDHVIDGERAGNLPLTPELACRWGAEAEARDYGWSYSETNRYDARVVYDVYRVDVGGSEAVPVVRDGQDQEMIDAVERDCEYVASVVKTDREDI